MLMAGTAAFGASQALSSAHGAQQLPLNDAGMAST
jgi:hypothetical protein